MRKLRNYEKELENLYSAMLWNIWNLIEKYGVGDDRCYVPQQFATRELKWDNLCEVDINGCSYDVDEVKVSLWNNEQRLAITSNGYEYSVSESCEVLTVLKAVHKYFSMRDIWKKEKKDRFDRAIKFVEEHLLDRVYVEKIRLSLHNVDVMRCPIDSDITDAISDLLNEFGSDNDLPRDWYESEYLFTDLEDIFWQLDIDYDEED